MNSKNKSPTHFDTIIKTILGNIFPRVKVLVLVEHKLK